MCGNIEEVHIEHYTNAFHAVRRPPWQGRHRHGRLGVGDRLAVCRLGLAEQSGWAVREAIRRDRSVVGWVWQGGGEMSDRRGQAHADREQGRRDILADWSDDAEDNCGAEKNCGKRHKRDEEGDRGGPPAQRQRRHRCCATELVVTNIPSSTPLNAIVHHFSRYGEVRHVKTSFSTRTNVMKALVRFKDAEAKDKVTVHQRMDKNNNPSRHPTGSCSVAPQQQTKRNGTPPRDEEDANVLRRNVKTIAAVEPPVHQVDCNGESKYRTPPMTQDSRSVKLQRSSSLDTKHEVSNMLCALAGMAHAR